MLRLLFAFGCVLCLLGCSPSGIEIGDADDQFELTLLAGANGTVTATGVGPYNRNQIVELTATPDAGYQVSAWSGTMDDGTASVENFVRMNDDKTVTVSFKRAITLSGNVTFDKVPATATGLNYAAITAEPVRGAIIEVQDQHTNVVYNRTNSDAAGAYSISVPENTDIRIIVQAALGTPGDPHTLVVDNTDNESLYSMFLDMTSPAVDTGSIDLHADDGWGGTSYTGTRVSGPFAILDVIYLAEQMVLAADPDAVFPQLTVNWSVNNRAVPGNLEDGDISTSFYTPNGRALYILGSEDEDTDEFDSSIIAHEWTHYFEDVFSRSDSIGGEHMEDDLLDPTVAFGEGFANALSGIILNDNNYYDTMGLMQANTPIDLDLEANEVLAGELDPDGIRRLDGYWSENSIQEILYDIMDANDDNSDTISLGFDAIYTVMTQDYKNSAAFTTLPTFLYYLKQQQPAAVDLVIESIANDENVIQIDEFDVAAPLKSYTDLTLGVPQSVDVNGDTIVTESRYGTIAASGNNKLLHRRFFKASLAAGTYEIIVTPNTGEQFTLNYAGGDLLVANSAGAISDEFVHAGGDVSFAIGTINDPGQFTVVINLVPAGVSN